MVLKIVGSATCPPEDFADFSLKFVKEVFNVSFASNQPKPFQEEAEEIRLLLVKLVTALAVKTPREETFDSCMISLKRALSDNFPEVKRECCLFIAKVSKDDAGARALRAHGEVLVRNLLSNLGHQHSKTRQMTVKAIGIVLAADGGMEGVEKVRMEGGGEGGKRLLFKTKQTS